MRQPAANAEVAGTAQAPACGAVTVTPNVALDVTYQVDELLEGSSHRVLEVHQVAGGKGVNVASVLATMGCPGIATGLLGGHTGTQVRADLDIRHVPHSFVDIDGETRRTLTIVDRATGEATVLNEPGPQVCAGSWDDLVRRAAELASVSAAKVIVGSGSLPPGAPSDGYAQLVAAARAVGCHTVVDCSGAALVAAVAAGPDVVKPNLAELGEATGMGDPEAGIRSLQAKGARVVLLSLGADGMVLAPPQGPWLRAHLPDTLSGNPTGAGDAAVAAVAATLATGGLPQSGLRDAVAWSAAAVLAPTAGATDPTDVRKLAPQVRVDTYPEGGGACWQG
jgi:1-phosphofructokinase family hexose kinase